MTDPLPKYAARLRHELAELRRAIPYTPPEIIAAKILSLRAGANALDAALNVRFAELRYNYDHQPFEYPEVEHALAGEARP